MKFKQASQQLIPLLVIVVAAAAGFLYFVDSLLDMWAGK